VVGAQVVRLPFEHAFEQLHYLARVLPGLRVLRPVVPGHQIHQRLGVERRHVDIVGPASLLLAHRHRVGEVEGRAVLGRNLRIAGRQCLDEGALLCGRPGREAPGLLQRGPGRPGGLGAHGCVDVRPEGEGRSPEAHGAGRIDAGRLAEGALRGVVVEAVGERQPLVEVALGHGLAGGDGERVVPQPGQQLRSGIRFRLGGIPTARHGEGEQDCEAECVSCFHGNFLPPGF
jgi:hypothetical protein